jgi:hypothetical protein
VVVEAVASDPATFGDLPAAMDQSGKVHLAFQEVKRRRKRQELEARAAAAPPPPTTPGRSSTAAASRLARLVRRAAVPERASAFRTAAG